MSYSLQQWATCSFTELLLHSSTKQCAHQKCQDLVGREALWSCQNANTMYFTVGPCMHTLHPLGSLAFLATGQVHYGWWLGHLLLGLRWRPSRLVWGRQGEGAWGDCTEGIVQIGQPVVAMGYSYWELMRGISEMYGIKEEELPERCPRS